MTVREEASMKHIECIQRKGYTGPPTKHWMYPRLLTLFAYLKQLQLTFAGLQDPLCLS